MVAFLEGLSGLNINRSTCTIFGINTNIVKLQSWVEMFDCEVGSFSLYYLGFPLGGQSESYALLGPVCEKIHKSLAG